tara:strand:+ start:277 stop:543 length:267 start_codon:yes stop_codon:yes gene_type:complete
MKLIKKIKKFLFKIQEIIWWISASIEDILYPYNDRPVDYFDELFSDDDQVDDIANIYSQLESANERIQRLQSEMIHVLDKIERNYGQK